MTECKSRKETMRKKEGEGRQDRKKTGWERERERESERRQREGKGGIEGEKIRIE